MKTDNKFMLGILGGMGPMAGVEFQKRIIEKTPACSDSDHIKMICFTDPKIKDRTQCIKAGDDFSDEIVDAFNSMKKMGVNIGVIACNTAHASFGKIKSRVNFPLLNIINETVEYIGKNYENIKKVGLLATDGTIRSKIYHKVLNKKGFAVKTPKQADQKMLMSIIYGKKGIKAGYINENAKNIENIIFKLRKNGAEVVILGCTELSLLNIEKYNIIDPIEIVSGKIIQLAKEPICIKLKA